MTDDVHYRNAPIAEAVFDVRAILPADFDCNKFENFHDEIKKEFPTKEVSLTYTGSIKIEKGQKPVCGAKESGLNGFLFKSTDGTNLIQFKTSGFTFNKLRPYDNWKSFSEDAKKYLEEYLRITSPIKITRVGLRYINRLDIPLPIEDFEDYLNTVPYIAPEIPQVLAEFFMRLVIPNSEDVPNVAIITETIDNKIKTDGTFLPLILDIDVFREVDLNAGDKKIYEIFENLREYKNTIFNSSITDKMKQLIS